MANIKTNKEHKNSNKQPKGTLPADKLKQFKLHGNLQEPVIYVTRNTKKIAQSVRAIAAYRAAVHNVTHTGKLPACLRTSVHYFQVPMSRADSDNARDRKGIETAETVK
jgi:hypothetical protein